LIQLRHGQQERDQALRIPEGVEASPLPEVASLCWSQTVCGAELRTTQDVKPKVSHPGTGVFGNPAKALGPLRLWSGGERRPVGKIGRRRRGRNSETQQVKFNLNI